MRKLILQIRYTIFSRSLCVRHLQTILPYSPYLHGIFTIYSNFTPHTRIYFCKAESFLLNWNLLFQFTSFSFCRNSFKLFAKAKSRETIAIRFSKDIFYLLH